MIKYLEYKKRSLHNTDRHHYGIWHDGKYYTFSTKPTKNSVLIPKTIKKKALVHKRTSVIALVLLDLHSHQDTYLRHLSDDLIRDTKKIHEIVSINEDLEIENLIKKIPHD